MGPATRKVLRAVHRMFGPVLPPKALAFQCPLVPGRIHVDDQMLTSQSDAAVTHYLSVGRSALDNIEASLVATGRGWSDVVTCLDLPCGYGRVTRHLVQRVAASSITACDIDRQAVRFCAAEFGVQPLYSAHDLRRLRFPRHYDFIFVGSLLTHVAPPRDIHIVEALAAVLAPSGLLIFSTQGVTCLKHLSWYGVHFAKAEKEFRHQLEKDGVAWVPYPGREDYGITLHARESLKGRIETVLGDHVSLVRFAERGWDAHQDVWSYQRSA